MPESLPFLLLICSGAVFLAIALNKKIEQMFPVWIFIMIGVLYLCGIFKILIAGVYIVIALGSFGLLYSGYTFITKKRGFTATVLTPGLIVFIAFFVLSWWMNKDRMLSSWDEFSHWGLVAKNMFCLDALGNHPAATTAFKTYPPATALLQYIWLRFNGVFTEDIIYRALNLLYFSLMMPLFKDLKFKNAGQIILRALFVLVVPLTMTFDFYASLYVDTMLGILFAYALVNYFSDQLDSVSLLNTGLALFVLTLTKAAGGGLAFIAVIIIAIDMLFFKRQTLKPFIRQGTWLKTAGRLLLVLSPLLLTLIAKYSWDLYLRASGTPEIWNTKDITLPAILDLFGGNAPQYRKDIIYNFFSALTNSAFHNILINITFIAWMVFFICLGLVMSCFICRKDEQKRFMAATFGIIGGAAIYAFGLLLLYLFTFSEYEAVVLAAFQRYMISYLSGSFVFFTVTMLKQVHDSRTGLAFSAGLMLLILVITNRTPILDMTVKAPIRNRETVVARAAYQWALPPEHYLDQETDKVYFISIADAGYHYWVNRYNLTPLKMSDPTWSLGKEPYYEGDIWTVDISPDAWGEMLKDAYTHVYVYKTNEIFSRDYGSLFEGGRKAVQDNTLYSVDKTADVVLLKKVQPR